MDYGLFKGLQGLLFFGAAFGWGIWQLVALKRDARKAEELEESAASKASTAAEAE